MDGRQTRRVRNYDLGKHLLLLRTRIGLTQTTLAEALGVHYRTVQNWETGASHPKADALQQLIATFLNRRAFTPGQERAEALALWNIAVENTGRQVPAFDTAWFDRILRTTTIAPTTTVQPTNPRLQLMLSTEEHATQQRALIDWGEAMDVPALYGRDPEIITLQRWIVEERRRVVALVGHGGIGKSSLAITFARHYGNHFEVVLFRSLQNGPSLSVLLDQLIYAVSEPYMTPPEHIADKIAVLVQLFRKRRCLLILDNFEAILQPNALAGAYRTGYAEYGALLQALGERAHQSCLLLTSREKPVELGPLEGHSMPVRALLVPGLDTSACHTILRNRDIDATPDAVSKLVHLYSGNSLALHLVTEPIRELFGGDVDAFLTSGDTFLSGLHALMEQQCARTTRLEHDVLYWLAIEREHVPVNTLLARLAKAAPKRRILAALESLRRRVQIESSPNQPSFTLQPTILEFVTNQMVGFVCQEIVDSRPVLLSSHALVQATAKEYVRVSQERLIVTALLERLVSICGDVDSVERRLLSLLDFWRDQSFAAQGYGPGNVVNLLRVLRGTLHGLDLSRLLLRQAYFQGMDVQDSSLANSVIQESIFTDVFDAVSAVAAGGGAYWASASRRGEVRVWIADTQILHRAWQAHADMVCTIAFSPDGKTLATSGSWDGTIKLWDVVSGKLLWFGRHTPYVNIVAFAPDGSTLVSVGNDATVQFWDRQTGMPLEALQHPQVASSIAWSPESNLLATSDQDGQIRLWMLDATEPSTCIQTFIGHTNRVEGLAFAPDGRLLASAGWDGTVKLWDVAEGSLRRTFIGHTGRVNHVAWSRDGRILASASRDGIIWLWDIEQGVHRTILQGHVAGVTGLAFIPGSNSLLSGSEDGTLRVWDVTSGQCIHSIEGYAAPLYDVDWSYDGTRVASSGADRMVTIYEVAGEMPPLTLRGHSGVVIGVGYSPDGMRAASSEWDNVIRLWELTSGTCEQVFHHPHDTENFFDRLAWSPDGQRLACATYSNGIQVFAITAQGTSWNMGPFPTWIRHVAWSPDGGYLAGGGADGTVYIWDSQDYTLRQQMRGHSSSLTSVTWHPDRKYVASGSGGAEGSELFIWDAQGGERISTITGHPEMVYAVAWGTGKHTVISGGRDGVLRWWDVERGECLLAREAHRGTIHSLKRSPDGTKLASCGDDGVILLWDLDTGTCLKTLRRDRPYERMNITGLTGMTEGQRTSLIALGAVGDRAV